MSRKQWLHRQRQRRLRKRRHAMLISKLGGKCAICGSQENLQFDHIDPDNKDFNIVSNLGSKKMTILLEEITKCQLLCRTHHLEKTSKERKEKSKANLKHGTLNAYYRHKCRCLPCKRARSDYYFKNKSQRSADKA